MQVIHYSVWCQLPRSGWPLSTMSIFGTGKSLCFTRNTKLKYSDIGKYIEYEIAERKLPKNAKLDDLFDDIGKYIICHQPREDNEVTQLKLYNQKIRLVWQGKRHFQKNRTKLFKLPGKGRGSKGELVSLQEFLDHEFSVTTLNQTNENQDTMEDDLDLPNFFSDSQGSDISSGKSTSKFFMPENIFSFYNYALLFSLAYIGHNT